MAEKPVVVLDTNVFVSGLLSPSGVPGVILARFRERQFAIATSKAQVREIQAVLRRPSLARALPKGTAREVVRFFVKFKRLTRVYDPAPRSRIVTGIGHSSGTRFCNHSSLRWNQRPAPNPPASREIRLQRLAPHKFSPLLCRLLPDSTGAITDQPRRRPYRLWR